MKKIICAILVILLLCGCGSNTTPKKNLENNSSPAKSNDFGTSVFSPVLFYDGKGAGTNTALVITTVQEKAFYNMNSYTYNGNKWDWYFKNNPNETVKSASVDGKKITFYTASGEKRETTVNSVVCEGRILDQFTEVQAITSTELGQERFIGLLSTQTPYPSTVKYTESAIEADLDGNGKVDRIELKFDDNLAPDGYYSCSIDFVINGKKHVYNTESDLFYAKDDIEVFVADLNGDKTMEIVIYERAFSLMSDVVIYQIVDEQPKQITTYTITPSP